MTEMIEMKFMGLGPIFLRYDESRTTRLESWKSISPGDKVRSVQAPAFLLAQLPSFSVMIAL